MKPENLRFTRNFLCSLLFLVVLIQRAQAADQVPVTLTLRYEESAAHPGAKQPVREGGITGAVEDVSKKINSPGDVGSGKIAAQLVLRLMPVVETSVDGSSLARLDVTQVSWTLPTGLSAEAAGQVRLDRINVIDRLKQWRSSIPSTPRVTVNGVGGHSLPLELAFVDLRRLRSPPSSVFVAVDATPANYLFTWLVDDRFGATRLASQSPVGSIVRLRARIRGGIAPDRIDVPVRIFHADGKRESRTLRLDRLAAGTTLESAPMRLTAKTAPPADAMYALGGTRLE
ncbi:MAG TPA: hypothetical protein VK968_06520, partial [Roseimicrobium sp.]|nr:hypothetical protein [Roseimicrobium sp.]